jgi:hypothetical protein
MMLALCSMSEGTSLEKARFAMLWACGKCFSLMLCGCVVGGSVPYRNEFIVGPNRPNGLIANGMSCFLELYSSPMIWSPDSVIPVLEHVLALFVLFPR